MLSDQEFIQQVLNEPEIFINATGEEKQLMMQRLDKLTEGNHLRVRSSFERVKGFKIFNLEILSDPLFLNSDLPTVAEFMVRCG